MFLRRHAQTRFIKAVAHSICRLLPFRMPTPLPIVDQAGALFPRLPSRDALQKSAALTVWIALGKWETLHSVRKECTTNNFLSSLKGRLRFCVETQWECITRSWERPSKTTMNNTQGSSISMTKRQSIPLADLEATQRSSTTRLKGERKTEWGSFRLQTPLPRKLS